MDDVSDEELCRHVIQFLREIKELIHQEGLFIQDRVKNKESLIELGLTSKQRNEEVLSLSVENYCSGPHDDIYAPGIYWVFGKQINNIEVYIKLKIAGQPGEERATCFSFHKAEGSLTYPLSK